jgi:hypothetical protein
MFGVKVGLETKLAAAFDNNEGVYLQLPEEKSEIVEPP